MKNTVELAIAFRVRRRWLLTLAKWTAKVHKPTARRMAMHTVVQYRPETATGNQPWQSIDMKEALR